MLTLGRKTLSVPILQGGMGVGVSLGGLAGAVAACGGMGCISTAAYFFHMCIGKTCCTVTFFSRYSMPRPSLPSPRRGSSGAIAAVISGAMLLSVASLRTAEASFSMAAW